MSDLSPAPTPTNEQQDTREKHQIVSVGRSDLPGGVYVKCRCDEHVLIPAAAYTDHVLAAVSAAAPERSAAASDISEPLAASIHQERAKGSGSWAQGSTDRDGDSRTTSSGRPMPGAALSVAEALRSSESSPDPSSPARRPRTAGGMTAGTPGWSPSESETAAAPDASRALPDGTYVLTVADGRSSVAPTAAAPDEREALAKRLARDLAWHGPWEVYLPTADWIIQHDAALAARPAPVVSGAMADAAIEALGMNAYMTPERMTAHHAALGVVWTDPRTVADAPAADDEGARA